MSWAALAEALARSSSAARCSSVGWMACWNWSIGRPAMSRLSAPHICANWLGAAAGASAAGAVCVCPPSLGLLLAYCGI